MTLVASWTLLIHDILVFITGAVMPQVQVVQLYSCQSTSAQEPSNRITIQVNRNKNLCSKCYKLIHRLRIVTHNDSNSRHSLDGKLFAILQCTHSISIIYTVHRHTETH